MTIGLAVLKRMNECNLEPQEMDRWPAILKLVKGEDKHKGFIAVNCGNSPNSFIGGNQD